MTPLTVGLGLVAAASLLLAGCSGGTNGGSTGSSPTPVETLTADLPRPIGLEGVPQTPLTTLETARLTLDSPDWLTVADDALWVRLDTGEVVRVDPQRAKITAGIAPAGQSQFATCQAIGAGKAVWACGKQFVQRIDPARSIIVETFELDGSPRQGHLVVADDRVWLISRDGSQLIPIAEATDAVGDPIALPATCSELAARGNTIWAACPSDNAVLEIDAPTGAVTRELTIEAPESVAAGRYLWVTAATGVVQIDPEGLSAKAVYDLGGVENADVSESSGAAWIRTDGGPFLVGIDPAKAEVFAVVTDPDLRSGGNSQFIDGQLWASAYDDGTLVRLRPPER